MIFLKTSLRVIAMGVIALNTISCGSSDSTTPSGSNYPDTGTVTVEGINYRGAFSTARCLTLSSDKTFIVVLQNSSPAEVVTTTVRLGDTPNGNKTYNITSAGTTLGTSAASIEIEYIPLSSQTTSKRKSFRATSSTIQASLEDGKVVVKFSNIPTELYDPLSNKVLAQTIIAGNIKCN